MSGVEHVKVIILPDDKIDRKNAARALNRAPKTLAEWRSKGIGPRSLMIGGRCFYRWSEIQAFMNGEVR